MTNESTPRTCGQPNTDFNDPSFNQPCQLPAGHEHGHWYGPLVTQESVDRMQGR